MGDTQGIILRPGDAILWMPDPDENVEPTPLRVADDNEALLFPYAPKPWHDMVMPTKDDMHRRRGYTRIEAEMVLNGELPFAFPGRIYKWFDGETRERLPDPEAT